MDNTEMTGITKNADEWAAAEKRAAGNAGAGREDSAVWKEKLAAYAQDGDVLVSPWDEKLQYEGRIDFSGDAGPVWVYPATYVRMRFTGDRLSVVLTNEHAYWDNYLGYLLDGKQYCVKLPESGTACVELVGETQERNLHLPEADGEGWGSKTAGTKTSGSESAGAEAAVAEKVETAAAERVAEAEQAEAAAAAGGAALHDLLLFKRQDSCHMVQIHGFVGSDNLRLLSCEPLPSRRIEVYGDSVSAGEVSEAVAYCGLPDPDHHGEYSNSYYSYAWLTARRLGARLHDIAQGGIALMDGCGYFMEPQSLGMESTYDRIQYQPQILAGRPAVKWDFDRYRPQIVIVALGQNDAHPADFCGEDYEGEKSAAWRRHYAEFVRKLCRIHPQAQVICMTTILGHHSNWDRAIGEMCALLQAEHLPVHHFLFSNNGCGTKGHIRIPEAERMAEELSAFIDGLGEDIWRDTVRLENVMERAAAGEDITVGFLGGSITQGSLASEPGKCYAALTYDWWRKHFPASKTKYVNAGIGGTTSHFGAARVEADLLSQRPDVVFVEFSVNDTDEAHFMETYEGLIRRIWSCDWQPAIVLIHNRFYNSGATAQPVHDRIGRYYELPRVCVGDVLYGKLQAGEMKMEELTPDGLHPNDKGHAMIAEMICEFLEKADAKRCEKARQETLPQGKIGQHGWHHQTEAEWHSRNHKTETVQYSRNQQAEPAAQMNQVSRASVWVPQVTRALQASAVSPLPAPLTRNRYEHARRLRAADIMSAEISGFEADPASQKGITDIFKRGWTAIGNGSEITFRFRASCIAIQYRRTIRGRAPKAQVWLDRAGEQEEPCMILDGNFDETWGDCLALETVLEAETEADHALTLWLIDADGAEIPFYLVSLIVA